MESLADDLYYRCFQVESYHLNCPESVQSTECLQNDAYAYIKMLEICFNNIADKMVILAVRLHVYWTYAYIYVTWTIQSIQGFHFSHSNMVSAKP
jgi:hypothetical protein